MGTCASKYYPLKQEDANAICAKLEAATGIVIDPTQPTGTYHDGEHNIDINWTFDGTTINFTFPHVPMMIPCSKIYSKLDQWFKGE